MLYHLFSWLDKNFHVPGLGVFQFLTSRIAMAILLSLFIATVFGKKLILFLQKKQIGETVRELGLAGEQQKKGTPTMGGIIILLSVLIPTLLFANLDKVYKKGPMHYWLESGFVECKSGYADATTIADLIDPTKLPISNSALSIGDIHPESTTKSYREAVEKYAPNKYISISNAQIGVSVTPVEFKLRYTKVDGGSAMRNYQIFIFNSDKKYVLDCHNTETQSNVLLVDVTDFELWERSTRCVSEINIGGVTIDQVPEKYHHWYENFCEYTSYAIYYLADRSEFTPTIFNIVENGKLIVRNNSLQKDDFAYLVYNKATSTFHCVHARSLPGDDPDLEFVKVVNYPN